jgi:hypothetical protein
VTGRGCRAVEFLYPARGRAHDETRGSDRHLAPGALRRRGRLRAPPGRHRLPRLALRAELAAWVARGAGGHFVVKRLREAERLLDAAALERMRTVGESFRGRPYDLTFEWSDERIYCSELVWKIYQRAIGIEIGALQSLAEFDLSDPVVKAKLRERWGGPPPASEKFISPAAMFASDLLETVYER